MQQVKAEAKVVIRTVFEPTSTNQRLLILKQVLLNGEINECSTSKRFKDQSHQWSLLRLVSGKCCWGFEAPMLPSM
jgi:hypothetical protein